MRFIKPFRTKPSRPGLSPFAAACTALAAALCAGPAWSTPPVYNIVKLAPLKSFFSAQGSEAQGINKNGDITGTIFKYPPSGKDQISYGVIWPADGSDPILLQRPPFNGRDANSIPWALNNARSVAGMSVNYQGMNHFPERWTDGNVTPLQTPKYGQALAISEDNVAVGYTQRSEKQKADPKANYAIATIWAADGTPTAISTTPGALLDINASGYMLGLFNEGNYPAPFVRDPAGNLLYLQDLPGQTPTFSKYAWAFNDHNEAVGTCDLVGATTTNRVACLWSADGTATDLGRINDGRSSSQQNDYVAWGINNARQVTGYYAYTDSSTGKHKTYYTYWSDETGWVPILSLIDPADPLLAEAQSSFFTIKAINNDGVIVGSMGYAIKLVPKVAPNADR